MPRKSKTNCAGGWRVLAKTVSVSLTSRATQSGGMKLLRQPQSTGFGIQEFVNGKVKHSLSLPLAMQTSYT
jgi:hypothetical protein